jgi:ABC-type Zn2+ transport system substrate-binding protein/surface adhesin
MFSMTTMESSTTRPIAIEGAQGQDVQRVAERLDADKRDEDAGRDGDRGHERRAHRQQEEKDHEHGEDEAQQPSWASDSIDCSM